MMSPEQRKQLTKSLSPADNEHLSAHANVLVPMDDWMLLIVDKVVTAAIERHTTDCPLRNKPQDVISTRAMVKILAACGTLAAAIAGGVAVILGAMGK